jgi:hypothetical protein
VPGTSPFINVTDPPFGAKGDGSTDDANAIRAAIAAAAPSPSNPSGNTVFLPAGNYLVGSTLTVPAAVTIQGCGWNTPGAGHPFLGSWIFVEAGASFSPVAIAGNGGAVRNLGFNVYNQSSTEQPASAEPMILISGRGANNALIEDVCLYNPYAGIYINNTAAQAVLRRVFGQPIRYGIMIDQSQDSNYIDSVHFWPYWQPMGSTVGAYQLANGSAIVLLRCDNPHISNVLALGYNIGLALSSSPGPGNIPHKVRLVNADFDGCVTGIYIDSPGQAGNLASIQMTNVTIQASGVPGAPAGHGIWVRETAAYAKIQASNVRVSQSGQHAIHIDAPNATFYGENISIENWHGDCGFSITDGSSGAWLGVGFAYTAGGTPYAPGRQFHVVRA